MNKKIEIIKEKKRKKMIRIGVISISSVLGIVLIIIFVLPIFMTPQQVVYPEGYYDATYTFTEDNIGDVGIDISWLDYGTAGDDCKVEIVEEYEEHNKVMRIQDYSKSYKLEYGDNFGIQPSGTIEFWIAFITQGRLYITPSGGQDAFTLYYVQGNLRVIDSYDPSQGFIIQNIVYGRWYHIRMDFECTDNEYEEMSAQYYRIYVDHELKRTYTMYSNDYIDNIRFYTTEPDGNSLSYMDAVGYSWDLGYDVGDNSIPIEA